MHCADSSCCLGSFSKEGIDVTEIKLISLLCTLCRRIFIMHVLLQGKDAIANHHSLGE